MANRAMTPTRRRLRADGSSQRGRHQRVTGGSNYRNRRNYSGSSSQRAAQLPPTPRRPILSRRGACTRSASTASSRWRLTQGSTLSPPRGKSSSSLTRSSWRRGWRNTSPPRSCADQSAAEGRQTGRRPSAGGGAALIAMLRTVLIAFITCINGGGAAYVHCACDACHDLCLYAPPCPSAACGGGCASTARLHGDAPLSCAVGVGSARTRPRPPDRHHHHRTRRRLSTNGEETGGGCFRLENHAAFNATESVRGPVTECPRWADDSTDDYDPSDGILDGQTTAWRSRCITGQCRVWRTAWLPQACGRCGYGCSFRFRRANVSITGERIHGMILEAQDARRRFLIVVAAKVTVGNARRAAECGTYTDTDGRRVCVSGFLLPPRFADTHTTSGRIAGDAVGTRGPCGAESTGLGWTEWESVGNGGGGDTSCRTSWSRARTTSHHHPTLTPTPFLWPPASPVMFTIARFTSTTGSGSRTLTVTVIGTCCTLSCPLSSTSSVGVFATPGRLPWYRPGDVPGGAPMCV